MSGKENVGSREGTSQDLEVREDRSWPEVKGQQLKMLGKAAKYLEVFALKHVCV